LRAAAHRGRFATVLPDVHRERAIVAFVGGDTRGARDLFLASGAELDYAYLAEFSALEGDVASSALHFARVFAHGVPEARIVGALLRACERSGAAALRELARRNLANEHTVRDAEAQLRAMPLRAGAWNEMATLRRILGDEEEALRCAERAGALTEAAE